MRVVLVQPPYSSDFLDDCEAPLGILAIGTMLLERGDWVKVLDLQRAVRHGELPLDDTFYSMACDRILAHEPDVVGFTAMSVSLPSAVLIAKELRERRPETKIMLGGPQPTLTADQVMETFPWVDVIVRGEAELTVLDVMAAFEGQIELATVDGIHYRDMGMVWSTKNRDLIDDLDSLPPIRYELLEDIDYYKRQQNGLPSMPIDSGRGCPWGCTFCSTTLVWRRKFRLKSMPRLLSEMENLRDRYGIRAFSLQHDMFTTVRKLVVEFCTGLIEANNELHWGCSSRVDTVDRELLTLMARAGCRAIFFGVESGSPEMQKEIQKRLDVRRALDVVRDCAELNISSTASFIVGFPEETEHQLNQTLELALACKALGAGNVQLHVLIPESGTALAREVKDRLVLREEHLRAAKALVVCEGDQELQLIKQYPELFAPFYNIQPTHLPIGLLYEIAATLRLLIYLYPRTLWLLTKAADTGPVELLRRFKQFLHREDDDLVLTDLGRIHADFAQFAASLIDTLPARYRTVVESIFRFEEVGAGFRVEVAKQPDQPVITPEEDVYFVPARARVLQVHSSVTKVVDGIRQGLSLDALAENETPEWVVFMGWGRRTRTIIGVSTLKAFLIDMLGDGPLSGDQLKDSASARWPQIAAAQLGAQVDIALTQLMAGDMIGYSRSTSGQLIAANLKKAW